MQTTDRSKVVILVVDGEVVSRNTAANRLHRDGYTVLAAAHAEEALDLLRSYSGTVDLVVADVNTRRMDCGQFCAEVAKEKPEIKTCVMSANGSDESRAVSAGVPFLLK